MCLLFSAVPIFVDTCCTHFIFRSQFRFSLAFVALLVEEEDSYYSEHSDDGEKLKEAYKTLYIEYEKMREGQKQHIHDLNN
jgi:hypothetical protein